VILFILLALAAWLYFSGVPTRLRNRLRRPGAGASAAARARQLRTPAVRIADHLGIPTQRSRHAARWAAGAEGEQRTARRLASLDQDGWTILHDRALPGSRANLDHLAISPDGVVIVPDTKRWSARWPVTVHDGRLYHGDRDVTARLSGLRHEADTVSRVLGVSVIPVVLMDGPRLDGGPLRIDGIRIVAADQACRHLHVLAGTHSGHPHPGRLAAEADRSFPPYTRRNAR
jgi:hypothetical protein